MGNLFPYLLYSSIVLCRCELHQFLDCPADIEHGNRQTRLAWMMENRNNRGFLLTEFKHVMPITDEPSIRKWSMIFAA